MVEGEYGRKERRVIWNIPVGQRTWSADSSYDRGRGKYSVSLPEIT